MKTHETPVWQVCDSVHTDLDKTWLDESCAGLPVNVVRCKCRNVVRGQLEIISTHCD